MIQKELTDRLELASILYYNGCTSEFSDIEFDLKLKELQKMEKESGIIYPNSPTIKVGSDIQDSFRKGEHPIPMLTIDNVYDNNGLIKWFNDLYSKYGVKEYNVSIKYDGISCELWYKGGNFIKALTRGDKNIGDDITENVKTIKNIPLKLQSTFNEDEMFYIRGEILLPKCRLSIINEERINNGGQPFSNTRNACSGSIKQLNPKITSKRGLIFKAWDCFGDKTFKTMLDKIDFLIKNKFYYEENTKPFNVKYDSNKTEEILGIINNFKNNIDSLNLDYDYDGIVIKIDDITVQDSIGTSDLRSIEWGIARKWNEDREVRTKLLGVDWQVGRTGVLTPVGRLEPVICDDVEISNVTLHNWDFIGQHNIKIGSQLRITRSGGVIPYVIECINMGNEQEIPYPHTCPICGSRTDVLTEVLIGCSNIECPSKIEGRIIHFCSKECMDIRGLGESVIKTLVKKGLVKYINDLYELKRYSPKELSELLGEGFGEKSCNKILNSIEESKNKPFENVLSGLSIPNIGKVMARTLVNKFKDIEILLSIDFLTLMSIEGIGEKMAIDIEEWFASPINSYICRELKVMGLNLSLDKEETKKVINENGIKVCFTGSSNRYSGNKIEEFLEENGFKCTSVNKKLDYLILGEKPGSSKIKKAEELGIKIISENDFYNLFKI